MMTPQYFKGFKQIFNLEDAELLREARLLYATFSDSKRGPRPRPFQSLYGVCNVPTAGVGVDVQWVHEHWPVDTFYIKLE